MYKRYFKRSLDLFFSIIAGIISLPIIVIAIFLIKIFDSGPVIFVQNRTGLNGKVFRMYKFRTMSVNTVDDEGNVLKHNERISKVGHFLRKTSIDELPQILNIIKGDMSFVGPRPWIPEYYKNFNDTQKNRTAVLPGITGLAQAKGRNGLNIFEKIKYDVEYAENISFRRDVKIILMSIYIILKREHAEIIQEDIQEEIALLKENIRNTEQI
ncbi:MAG: sugar transferase [Clostridia bacterium]